MVDATGEDGKPGDGPALEVKRLTGDVIFYDVKYSVETRLDPILVGLSGRVKVASVCAVLGPSGGGKTTLLDILAHRKTTGLVTGQLPPIAKEQLGYVTQDIVLPVADTVYYVIMTYAALSLPTSVSDAQKKGVVEQTLRMLNLEHCRETVIGGTLPGGTELRGLSGGEKRRALIGCSLVRNPRLLLLDEPTTGLDAGMALEVMSSMRNLADLGVTVISTIHQPRIEIWRSFDQAILLCKGVRVFDGKPDDVAPFFQEALGLQKSPDVNAADFALDNLAPMSREPAQEICEKFEAKFPDRLVAEQEVFDEAARVAREEPEDDVGFFDSGDRPDFFSRYATLVVRQFRKQLGDVEDIILQWVACLIVALVGCIPYAGQDTESSEVQDDYIGAAFYITFCASNIGMMAVPWLTDTRRLFLYERAVGLYDGAELYLSLISMDLVVRFVSSFLLWLPFWGIVGLRREANYFFFGWFIEYISLVCASAYSMFITSLSQSNETAVATVQYLNNVLSVYTGFFISVSEIPWFVRWIVYINPIYYMVAAQEQNQFNGKHIECGEDYEGHDCMQGDDYMSSLGFDIVGKGADALIVLLYFVVFHICTGLVLQYHQYNSSITSAMEALEPETDADLESVFGEDGGEGAPLLSGEQKGYTAVSTQSDAARYLQAPGLANDVAWSAIDYEVDVTGLDGNPEVKKIIQNACGVVKVKTTCAIMGPSGAGKSSLLDILARREMEGRVTGNLPDAPYQELGYVTQDEKLEVTDSVTEVFMFYAALSLPRGTSHTVMRMIVARVLRVMNLVHVKFTAVGGPLPGGLTVRGVSGGEKRRVSIGCALVRNPSLLMLDEPTSGLDAGMAFDVMEAMTGLTKHGVTVISTIHQPRLEIWREFDQVILMAKGNKVYDGPPSGAVPWFESQHRPKEDGENPADFCLDFLGTLATSEDSLELRGKWEAEHPEDSNDDGGKGAAYVGDTGEIDNPFADIWTDVPRPEFPFRYVELVERHFRSTFRNTGLWVQRYVVVVVFTLLIGFAYIKLQNDPYLSSQTNDRVGLLFVLVFQGICMSNCTIELFQKTRAIYFHERRQQLYGSTEFFLALITVEAVFFTFLPGLFFIGIVYWCGGLNSQSYRVAIGLYIGIFTTFVGSSFYTICGLCTPTMETAIPMMTIAVLCYQVFAGYVVKVQDMGKWCRWITLLVPTKYGFHGWVINEFKDVHIECDEDDDVDCMQGNDVIEYWGADSHPSGRSGDMGIIMVFVLLQYIIGGTVLGLAGERLRRK